MNQAVEDGLVEIGVGGAERVLVVDDDSLVRSTVCRLLKLLGYDVLSAVDGPSALGIAARQEVRIHLLLTDIDMPGMTGFDLRHHLVALRPETKFLFMTGNLESNLDASDGAKMLRKPFSFRELVNALYEVLEG